MALDAYVMPLWRFKADDFSSPLETAFGDQLTTITLADSDPDLEPEEEERPPWYLRFLAKIGIIEFAPPPSTPSRDERRVAAIKEVDALKAQLSSMIGSTIDWPDVGVVHCSQQFYEPVMMRAFAAWHDHREELPEFAPAPEDNYYKHPVWQLPKPAHRRFPTLVEHSLHTGYLLPVPFEGMYKVEPFKVMGRWEFFHNVASSQTILREAAEFLEFFSTLSASNEQLLGPGRLKDLRWYAEELRRMCQLSIEHRLPVIFHG